MDRLESLLHVSTGVSRVYLVVSGIHLVESRAHLRDTSSYIDDEKGNSEAR